MSRYQVRDGEVVEQVWVDPARYRPVEVSTPEQIAEALNGAFNKGGEVAKEKVRSSLGIIQ